MSFSTCWFLNSGLGPPPTLLEAKFVDWQAPKHLGVRDMATAPTERGTARKVTYGIIIRDNYSVVLLPFDTIITYLLVNEIMELIKEKISRFRKKMMVDVAADLVPSI